MVSEPPDLPAILRIHHVGIVVRDAETAARTYERTLGLEPVMLEEFRGLARVAFVRAGETLLEFIQPLTDAGDWAAALRAGEGVHHLALEVPDLRAAVARLTAAGLRVLDPRPERAPGNTLAVRLDPESTGGTRIELVQQITA
jgi:methylmalonyl-CoA/ethylmalonyl-CoA epimerase